LKKKKKLLIVGGTGFIGYNLINKLKDNKNYNITSLSSNYPKKERKFLNIKYIFCDISNKKKLKKKLFNKEFDYIINLGGYVNHFEKKKTIDSHFNGCKNLVEIFSKKKIKRFLQMGSSVEYGNLSSPQKENAQIQLKKVNSNYGKAKLNATNLLLDYHHNLDFPAIILRLYITFGPNQELNRFIPIVINECLKKNKFPCSTGTQLRDFIYIDDLVRLIIKCLNKKDIEGEIFNVGSGKPKKIKDIIRLIMRETKGGLPSFGKIKLRKDETSALYPDISKAKKILGWSPKVKFSKGLKQTISYYEKKYFSK
jgi:nucleoside-diphosphate-sugar epimerase